MGTQLPLSVRVSARAVGVVIDATFALSPLGLLTTLRLARAAEVWLPRGLRAVLDNDALYRRSPERLASFWLPEAIRAEALEQMAGALAPWQRAWNYGRLAAQVHWIGDAQYESLLPERGDTLLLPRFEASGAALDARRAQRQEHASAPLDLCARDALALAACLQPEPVVILTMGGPEGQNPPLCGWLAGAGIATHPVAAPVAAALLRDMGLGEALLPVTAARQPAALLHVVAPGVLALPEVWAEGEWDDLDETAEGARAFAWENAFVLWQSVEAPA